MLSCRPSSAIASFRKRFSMVNRNSTNHRRGVEIPSRQPNSPPSCFMKTAASLSLAILLILLIAGTIHAQSDSSLLKLEKEIPLLGIEGRVDHFSVDVQGKRLFVAALGNGTIEVLDVTKGERTGEIRAALRRTVLELSPWGWRDPKKGDVT
jgi:hypothetical protein